MSIMFKSSHLLNNITFGKGLAKGLANSGFQDRSNPAAGP